MGKINLVIAGDYLNADINHIGNSVYLSPDVDVRNTVEINKFTVDSYNVIDEKQQKSATSAVGRAVVGGVLLGGFGLFAGLTAKNKRSFMIEISFKDNKRSMVLLDEKCYTALMKVLF